MWAGVYEGWRLASAHWVWLGMMWALAGTLWLLWCQARMHEGQRRRDVRMREELEAYARLEVRPPVAGDASELGRRVCRVVAEKSVFQRVAMLARGPEERLYVAGSKGMDDQTITALRMWGERVVEAEHSGAPGSRRGDGGLGMRVGEKSFAIVLGSHETNMWCGRAIVTPLWTSGGRMVGALAVCADRLLSVRRSTVAEAMTGLEALALKLGRSIENSALAERLLKAEKLAGLGLMAGGVAHELNNPLTAVLGFAELIANSAAEARVQEDAETILREARRMRKTVQSLLNYGQPEMMADEMVEVPELMRELARECEEKLEDRGVRLVVEAEQDVPAIHGSRDRLRQVMEHLLNNAAQAVGVAKDLGVEAPLFGVADGQHSIRVTVSHDQGALHLIVSDTGPGFREPQKMFDPLHAMTTKGERAGVGLSVCYGIVREHGGEISAFNLHPHGAAVIVELPVIRHVARTFGGVVPEAASA
jgi:signal transduction histidine kinase